MANEFKNKIIYNGTTLIDLTADTVDAAHLLEGYTAHDKSGATITGQCSFDADTSDADAAASEILSTKTAYVNGSKVTGSMTNRGAVAGTITAKDTSYTIPGGYHDGSGTVTIADKDKLVAQNIRSGIQILGVTGTMSGSEDAYAQTTTVTPSTVSQNIVPSGYVLLENEPNDWETDFTNYYVKGSGDIYSHVEADPQTGGAPTWQSNTYYAAYTYLAQVTVNAIPYTETDNPAGGVTVTIG